MTDTQILTIALASVPTTIAVLVGILINNARLTDLRVHMDERFRNVDQRFNEMGHRFVEMNELWRSDLHRVEEILDARLKRIEER